MKNDDVANPSQSKKLFLSLREKARLLLHLNNRKQITSGRGSNQQRVTLNSYSDNDIVDTYNSPVFTNVEELLCYCYELAKDSDAAEIRVSSRSNTLCIEVFVKQQGITKKLCKTIIPYNQYMENEFCNKLVDMAMLNNATISSGDTEHENDDITITLKGNKLPIYLSSIMSMTEAECLLVKRINC